MTLRIAMLGDIVGTPGRLAVAQCLPMIREELGAELVIANAENAANGSGLTPDLYQKLCDAGVDGMTLGDHVYRKQQIVSTLQRADNLIRPANLPRQAAGKSWMRLPIRRQKTEDRRQEAANPPAVYVLTVLGRLFMNLPASDPFVTVDQVLSQLPEANPIVLVEIHAEATSEKLAMGWYLNGRVAAVFGTHTHVPTADYRILPSDVTGGGGRLGGGTAYISDLGMCGPADSVLGRRVDRVLAHMTTAMPHPFDVAEGNPRVQGVLVDIDEGRAAATHIERIDLAADVTRPPFSGSF